MNDAKERYICSVTGKRCSCRDTGGGCSRRGNGKLDPPPAEALRWAKTALLRLDDAAGAVRQAELTLLQTRPFPGPEFRETQRFIAAATSQLKDIIQ